MEEFWSTDCRRVVELIPVHEMLEYVNRNVQKRVEHLEARDRQDRSYVTPMDSVHFKVDKRIREMVR